MILVSQVIIANAKVPDVTGITGLVEDVLKVDAKTYPLIGPSRPERDIRILIHLTSSRDEK